MISLGMDELAALAIGAEALFAEFATHLSFVFVRKEVSIAQLVLSMRERTLLYKKVTNSENGHSAFRL